MVFERPKDDAFVSEWALPGSKDTCFMVAMPTVTEEAIEVSACTFNKTKLPLKWCVHIGSRRVGECCEGWWQSARRQKQVWLPNTDAHAFCACKRPSRTTYTLCLAPTQVFVDALVVNGKETERAQQLAGPAQGGHAALGSHTSSWRRQHGQDATSPQVC